MGDNRPNRRSSRRRRRGRRKSGTNKQGAPAASQEQQDAGAQRQEGGPARPMHLKGPRSLERLRHHVEEAAHELERLREENKRLHERLQEAESRPVVDADEAVVTFDDDPEVLRQKVNSFIEVIDQYLDQSYKTSRESE